LDFLNRRVVHRHLFRRKNSKTGRSHRWLAGEVFGVHEFTIARSENLSNRNFETAVETADGEGDGRRQTVADSLVFYPFRLHPPHPPRYWVAAVFTPTGLYPVDTVGTGDTGDTEAGLLTGGSAAVCRLRSAVFFSNSARCSVNRFVCIFV